MRRIFFIFDSRRFRGLILLLFLQFGAVWAATLTEQADVRLPGGTLQDYAERIKGAAADVSSLYSVSDEDVTAAEKRDQLEFENRFFTNIAVTLPPKETVEWQGVQIEVDNRWLHSRLADLKKIDVNSPDRDLIVSELYERLEALGSRLAELQNATGGVRSKDEEKQKLAQILDRPEYQAPEKKEKSALQRWWESLVKWLQSLFPAPKPIDPMQPVSAPIPPELIQGLIVALALAAIGFVVWRFAPIFRNRRRRKKDAKDKGERIILGEKLAANESSASLFEQAEAMARDGNFRGAIRKGYISLLCELGDRRIVRLAQYKTNRDYLRDVSKNQELHHRVKALTSIFEDHWYGLATASEEEWGAFRENYRYSTGKL
jgi:hypothetical protein